MQPRVEAVIEAARQVEMWGSVLKSIKDYHPLHKEGVIRHLDEALEELKQAFRVYDTPAKESGE